MKLASILILFWCMQVLANVAFKWGSSGETGRSRRWLTGFIGGNVVGAASIYFLMTIYGMMPENSNLAAVLAGSGGFIGSQILLAWMFRSRLTVVQWAGVALVVIGSAVATLSGPEHVGFRGEDRQGWEEHILPHLLDEKTYERRINFEVYRALRQKCARDERFMTCGWHVLQVDHSVSSLMRYETYWFLVEQGLKLGTYTKTHNRTTA